jgi:hypothetical protein
MRIRTIYGLLGPALLISCGTDAGSKSQVINNTVQSRALSVTPTASSAASTNAPSAAETQRMQAFLAKRQSGQVVRHFFKTEMNQQIDCIDINSQPALHGGPVHSPPPPLPQRPTSANAPAQSLYSATPDSDGNDRQCPTGTIPIVRQTLGDLQQFHSLDAYLSKHADGTSGLPPAPGESFPSTSGHQYAITNNITTAYGGMETNINIWGPAVSNSADEFSLSQIWVVGNADRILGTSQQTAEAGVQVYPSKYGDQGVHLFIFATNDNYGSGSCYNNDCGNFVQVSNAATLGGYFSTISSQGGQQYDVRLDIEISQPNDEWWFGYEGTWIGYWDSSFYWPGRLSSNSADIGQAGGEIVNDELGGQHTDTQMGSGVFPCEASPICGNNNCCSYYADWQYVAYQRRLVQFNQNNQWSYASASGTATNPTCYSYHGTNTSDGTWGDYFFFGGPGGSYYCP